MSIYDIKVSHILIFNTTRLTWNNSTLPILSGTNLPMASPHFWLEHPKAVLTRPVTPVNQCFTCDPRMKTSNCSKNFRRVCRASLFWKRTRTQTWKLMQSRIWISCAALTWLVLVFRRKNSMTPLTALTMTLSQSSRIRSTTNLLSVRWTLTSLTSLRLKT